MARREPIAALLLFLAALGALTSWPRLALRWLAPDVAVRVWLADGEPRDPWGSRWRRDGHREDHYVVSAGPDRVLQNEPMGSYPSRPSGDDVLVRSTGPLAWWLSNQRPTLVLLGAAFLLGARPFVRRDPRLWVESGRVLILAAPPAEFLSQTLLSWPALVATAGAWPSAIGPQVTLPASAAGATLLASVGLRARSRVHAPSAPGGSTP